MSVMRLARKTVLITGAARGIGAALAADVAAKGARVSLVGLEPDLLASVCAELPGDGHQWHEADVTDQAALDAAAAATLTADGGIDVVVANAGIANLGTVAAGDIEAVARVIDVNLIGVARTVGATLRHVQARRGHLLLVSSVAAFTALPGMAAYCASKAGVEQFGNVLRLENAHLGVTVGTAHPIWVDTDLVRDAQADLASFRTALRRLPWPLNTTVTVAACAAAMSRGIERRKRRVYVPKSMAFIQNSRPLVLSPISDALVGRGGRRLVPQMEAEAAALGRSFGAHTVGVDAHAKGTHR
jgi:NAD(P)-dependent dehydrogenase (short-subunit alcohol dehydrogenase family)